MRIAICEDKQEDIEKIETMVCRVCDNIEEIIYCTDGNSLLAELEKNRADLVFLDIDLKERAEGILIKNKICKDMLEVYIIFVTSHNEYMPDAFGDRVLGFIIKDEIENGKANEKLNLILSNSGWKIGKGELIRTKDGTEFYSGKVMYIDCDKHISVIHTEHGGLLTTGETLSSIKERLSDEFFILELKSYIIAYVYIKSIEDKYIVLKNNMRIKIPRDKMYDIKSKFLAYKQKHMKLYI